MLTDPENVQIYLALPLIDRITNLLSCSLQDLIENATADVDHILCALATQDNEGALEIYVPQDTWDCDHLVSEHPACAEETTDYIDAEIAQTISKSKRSDNEALIPIRNLSFLTTINNKKVYWCPVAAEGSAPHSSNELFIRICDEFGKRWGDFLSTTDLSLCHEYWDETTRRVLGTPNAFIEYCMVFRNIGVRPH